MAPLLHRSNGIATWSPLPPLLHWLLFTTAVRFRPSTSFEVVVFTANPGTTYVAIGHGEGSSGHRGSSVPVIGIVKEGDEVEDALSSGRV